MSDEDLQMAFQKLAWNMVYNYQTNSQIDWKVDNALISLLLEGLRYQSLVWGAVKFGWLHLWCVQTWPATVAVCNIDPLRASSHHKVVIYILHWMKSIKINHLLLSIGSGWYMIWTLW